MFFQALPSGSAAAYLRDRPSGQVNQERPPLAVPRTPQAGPSLPDRLAVFPRGRACLFHPRSGGGRGPDGPPARPARFSLNCRVCPSIAWTFVLQGLFPPRAANAPVFPGMESSRPRKPLGVLRGPAARKPAGLPRRSGRSGSPPRQVPFREALFPGSRFRSLSFNNMIEFYGILSGFPSKVSSLGCFSCLFGSFHDSAFV